MARAARYTHGEMPTAILENTNSTNTMIDRLVTNRPTAERGV
jgi:hypothetical protein